MSNNQRGFSMAPLALLAIGIITLTFIAVIMSRPIRDKTAMQNELKLISLPANFKLLKTSFKPSGLDNDAQLVAEYQAIGTKDTVFQQVVKSLGLNPRDHIGTTDDELHGVTSPLHKYLYFLVINSDESKLPLCGGYNDINSYQKCLDNKNSLRKQLPVKSLMMTLDKRPGTY
jgi:hypothetical protein